MIPPIINEEKSNQGSRKATVEAENTLLPAYQASRHVISRKDDRDPKPQRESPFI